MNKKKSELIFIVSCLAPAFILACLFIAWPTISVFTESLFNKRGMLSAGEFVGLKNFEILFRDTQFIQSMQNIILIITLVTIFTLVLAILFATLLTREKFRGNDFFRIIFYIPNILSIVVIAGMFQAIYQRSNGILNTVLTTIGLDSLALDWFGDPNIIMYSIIFALIWQAIGYYMVMYMSAMSSIPENLYEAAGLEGAGKVKQFFMITLPLIWDNIRSTLTFFVISTINLSFMFVQITTEGNLGTQVPLLYMYDKAYAGNYSYGMACGVCIFIFSFVLSAIISKVTERDVYEF